MQLHHQAFLSLSQAPQLAHRKSKTQVQNQALLSPSQVLVQVFSYAQE